MLEIGTLRAKWRELETEPRILLNGHEGGNPGYSQASVLTGHRASSRAYRGGTPGRLAAGTPGFSFVGLRSAERVLWKLRS